MNRDILVAAHRGSFGGSVIQNTVLAFETALSNGADIIEVDVAKSLDGKFFAFHTGQEHILGLPKNIGEMTANEISSVNLINTIGGQTGQRLNTIDEILETFRGRCLINIDRSWIYGQTFIDYILAWSLHNDMQDQILIKTPVNRTYLQHLVPSILYMPIIKDAAEWKVIKECNLRIYAAELVFRHEAANVISDKFINLLEKQNIKKWVNAIKINDTDILAAGHDDNISVSNPDDGWGWLIKKGFDIIQTDWPHMLKTYLKSNNYATDV